MVVVRLVLLAFGERALMVLVLFRFLLPLREVAAVGAAVLVLRRLALRVLVLVVAFGAFLAFGEVAVLVVPLHATSSDPVNR
jgi:hypothetical protein